MIVAVTYRYVPDRDVDEARFEHRRFLQRLRETGVVVMAGALPSSHGALLILEARSPAAALDLLEDDPLLLRGEIAGRSAEEWRPVLGCLAP